LPGDEGHAWSHEPDLSGVMEGVRQRNDDQRRDG
jgi:hypothetical protein